MLHNHHGQMSTVTVTAAATTRYDHTTCVVITWVVR